MAWVNDHTIMVIWVIKTILYSSSVYSCHLFLISSASVGPYRILYCAHLCMKCSLGISYFLEELSSLSHSIVFFYFSALVLRKALLSLLAILWNSAFKWVYLSFSPLPFTSLLFSAICKASSDNHFAFSFLFLGDDLDLCLLYTVMNLHP